MGSLDKFARGATVDPIINPIVMLIYHNKPETKKKIADYIKDLENLHKKVEAKQFRY